MGRLIQDFRKRKKRKLSLLRQFLRNWLGITNVECKLHDTRELMFSLQDTVDGKGKRLRDRVRITYKKESNGGSKG